MITVSQRGKDTEKSLKKILEIIKNKSIYTKYAEEGVKALENATPKDTGLTAASWYYKIEDTKGGVTISWLNSNINKNVQIAIIIQFGHGTGTGGYVRGVDYINPAMEKVFKEMANQLWEEVSKS